MGFDPRGTPQRERGPERALFSAAPSPRLRRLLQAPAWLAGVGLGRLLGHRFLLLTHRGRRSGRVYRTPLEVVHYDPRSRESVVLSGWGERADWYRNIQSSPPIAVQTAGQRYVPLVRVLPREERFPIVVDYVRRTPAPLRGLIYRLGFDVRAAEDARRRHAEQLLLVGFRPGA
jgi:deazaflavin-dependent oxidoreductase (nitroreductase family)